MDEAAYSYRNAVDALFSPQAKQIIMQTLFRNNSIGLFRTSSAQSWQYSPEIKFHVAEHASDVTFDTEDLQFVSGIEVCIWQEESGEIEYGGRAWPRTMVASALLSARTRTVSTHVCKLPRFSDDHADQQFTRIFMTRGDAWTGVAEDILYIFAVCLEINYTEGAFVGTHVFDKLLAIRRRYMQLEMRRAFLFDENIRRHRRESHASEFVPLPFWDLLFAGTVWCQHHKQDETTGSRTIEVIPVHFTRKERRTALYLLRVFCYHDLSNHAMQSITGEFDRRLRVIEDRLPTDASFRHKMTTVLQNLVVLVNFVMPYCIGRSKQVSLAMHCLKDGVVLQSLSRLIRNHACPAFNLPTDMPADPRMEAALQAVQTCSVKAFKKAIQEMHPLSFTQTQDDSPSLLERIATQDVPGRGGGLACEAAVASWLHCMCTMVGALCERGCYLNALLQHRVDADKPRKVALVTFLSLWDYQFRHWDLKMLPCVVRAREFFEGLGAVASSFEFIQHTQHYMFTLSKAELQEWQASMHVAVHARDDVGVSVERRMAVSCDACGW